MPKLRSAAALVLTVCLATPVLAKDKVVRVTLGPFKIDAQRDREVCQAVRVPNVPGMEVVSYEVRQEWRGEVPLQAIDDSPEWHDRQRRGRRGL